VRGLSKAQERIGYDDWDGEGVVSDVKITCHSWLTLSFDQEAQLTQTIPKTNSFSAQ
jgi:hypothetical protein